MKSINLSIKEVVFILLCFFSITIGWKQYVIPTVIILSIVPVIILNKSLTNDDINIKLEKKFLHAFFLIFIVYMAIQLYYKYGLNLLNNMNEYTYIQLRLFQLLITATIFLSYFLKVSFKDFNWSITFKSFAIIVLVYIILELVTDLIYKDISNVTKIFTINYLKNFIWGIYYPSIVEEVIFRGLLLGGLLAYGIKKDTSNIIQSLVFGLIHILNYNEISLFIILSSFVQVYVGFVLGKIYIKTKSLTPCIILHALLDAM